MHTHQESVHQTDHWFIKSRQALGARSLQIYSTELQNAQLSLMMTHKMTFHITGPTPQRLLQQRTKHRLIYTFCLFNCLFVLQIFDTNDFVLKFWNLNFLCLWRFDTTDHKIKLDAETMSLLKQI